MEERERKNSKRAKERKNSREREERDTKGELVTVGSDKNWK